MGVLAQEFSGFNSSFQGSMKEMVKKEILERFWNCMDRTLDSVGNEYRLCILGDQNG